MNVDISFVSSSNEAPIPPSWRTIRQKEHQSNHDEEASLVLLNLQDNTDDDAMSFSSFDSTNFQQQSFFNNNSFGSILSSSRHSLGNSIGTFGSSVKNSVKILAKKAVPSKKSPILYCELEDIPSKEISINSDLNQSSAHSGTCSSDVTNEHSFAGDEDDCEEFGTDHQSPKPAVRTCTRRRNPLAAVSATSSSNRARARRASIHHGPASRNLPRNRKIRTSATDNNTSSGSLPKQNNSSPQSTHSRSSHRQHRRRLDKNLVLERCLNHINTAPKNSTNITSASTPHRGVRLTSLNEYFGRASPNQRISIGNGGSFARERVHFDFNPKDVKSLISNKQQQTGKKGTEKAQPSKTIKIVQPMLEPAVIALERLSLQQL